MSDLNLPRRAQNRAMRTDFAEARAHSVIRRHVLKLSHLTDKGRLHCRCADVTGTTAHLHSCSYNEVLRVLGTNQGRAPGALEDQPSP